MPRVVWVVLSLLAAGIANPVVAQQLAPLEPTGGPPITLDSTPVSGKEQSQRLPAILGAPVGLTESTARPSAKPAGFVDVPAERKPQRAVAFGAPTAGESFGAAAPGEPASPVPAAVVDSALARTAYNPSTVDPVGEFLSKRSDPKEREPSGRVKPEAARFGENLDGMIGEQNGGWFRSDHLFDGFISPVTNPFLAEDPRSLTELRPIFIIQKVPASQRDFRGGNITFFGTQARVAITDRWSAVFHKFGGISVNPGNASTFRDDTGFAEIWLGPKYTFYRGEETGAVAATGLQFQLPVGSKTAFQDTGTLSLVPYMTYGQNFLRDFRLGSFNSILSSGYAFSVNRERSDYYWLSAHVDFDTANLHRFYPLAELNWILYTSSGNTLPIGSEGRDLINFGGRARSGLLTGALGGRVKLTECAQFGLAFELPLAGRRDFFRYRFTLDFILRY